MSPTIHWFRHDLRLDDNPALHDAIHSGAIIPVYIHQPDVEPSVRHGSAASVWQHHALDSLNQSLGGKLHYCVG